MTTTIQKWGNSQGIRIPKFILETLHWSGSEQLVVTAKDDKIIIEGTLISPVKIFFRGRISKNFSLIIMENIPLLR